MATAEFSKFAGILNAALSQHHLSGFEIAQLEFPSHPLALSVVMLPKAHLISHSRMSGSRWVITPSWLSGSWRSFFIQFCVFFPPLLNIFCFCSVPTIYVLYWAHFCMKCLLGISNFLEEISSLSCSIVFLYFFALIAEDGFLISPWKWRKPLYHSGRT